MSEMRMLLIDDELGFREFVGKVAASAGYEVEVTSNAKDFMRIYESFDPTLIVMDMIMPEMDGFELMQWLISQDCRSRVLVVTGYNPHYAEMAETIGTDSGKLDVQTLTKPIRSNRWIRGAFFRFGGGQAGGAQAARELRCLGLLHARELVSFAPWQG